MKTAEAVTAWHVDKIADQISDAIVDACIRADKYSRVAVETMVGHGKVFLTGEVTCKEDIDYKKVVDWVINSVHNLDLTTDVQVITNIVCQSPDISQGVNGGGAGDQGIMIGYACNDNEAFIPQELYLAREILKPFKTDGKSQITLDNKHAVTELVLSVQGKTKEELYDYATDFLTDGIHSYRVPAMGIYCNNTGRFEIGGLDADSGCTGRKIVIDQYGPNVPVGGGAFSGKDPTKVDRSGSYMARWIALQELKKGAGEVLVKLAYVIGGVEPVMQVAIIDGKEVKIKYDCRPQAIIERFNLLRPIYYDTARYGHFGIKSYPWEKT